MSILVDRAFLAPQHRYVIYHWRDGEVQPLAECDTPEGIGVAIVTLAEDNRLAGAPAELFGVLDAENHWWLSLPFLPRAATPFHH